MLLIRKILPFLAVATFIVMVYDGWLFYSRWRDRQEADRVVQAEKTQNDRKTIDMLGGGRLKILSFYATPGQIRRGASANLCYGVYGAESVLIEPKTENVYPAVAHCVQVSPSRTTEYTLMAEDASSHSTRQSLIVRVAP
jgi:Lon protease-like protein